MPSAEPSLPHVFLISRLDLPQPHLSVQIAHAAIAAERAFGPPAEESPHPNLVVCAVADEAELLAEFERLKGVGIPVALWREEDMEGAATALGTAPLNRRQKREMRRYRLLR